MLMDGARGSWNCILGLDGVVRAVLFGEQGKTSEGDKCGSQVAAEEEETLDTIRCGSGSAGSPKSMDGARASRSCTLGLESVVRAVLSGEKELKT